MTTKYRFEFFLGMDKTRSIPTNRAIVATEITRGECASAISIIAHVESQYDCQELINFLTVAKQNFH